MAKATIGTLLNIKPILKVEDGLVTPVSTIRGQKGTMKKFLEYLISKNIDFDGKKIYVLHGDCIDKANEFINLVNEKFQIVSSDIVEIGCSVGTHAGPGVLGLVIFS